VQQDKMQFKFVNQTVVAEENKPNQRAGDTKFRRGVAQNPSEQNNLCYAFVSSLL
jgi:hypothetical protein